MSVQNCSKFFRDSLAHGRLIREFPRLRKSHAEEYKEPEGRDNALGWGWKREARREESESEAKEFSKCNFSPMAKKTRRNRELALRMRSSLDEDRGRKKNRSRPLLAGASHLYAVCTNERSVLVSLCSGGKKSSPRSRRRDLNSLFWDSRRDNSDGDESGLQRGWKSGRDGQARGGRGIPIILSLALSALRLSIPKNTAEFRVRRFHIRVYSRSRVFNALRSKLRATRTSEWRRFKKMQIGVTAPVIRRYWRGTANNCDPINPKSYGSSRPPPLSLSPSFSLRDNPAINRTTQSDLRISV